jgi:hypothetical protein
MTQKEIIRKAIEFLRAEMNTFGFIAQIKEQGFFRKDNSAIYFYDFLIYNRTNIKTGAKGFQLEPYATIHIPEIEDYFKEITTNKELKTEWSITTIGNSIANLLANPDGINRNRNQSLDLYVFDESHIKLVANELSKQFKKVALPYFITNNTVAKIDELLNEHPKEYCVHMSNDLYRFIKGLIAAKLNKNPKLNQLLEIYKSLIIKREMPQYCLEEMGKLITVLPMIGTKIKG